VDEFELHMKSEMGAGEHQVVTRVQGARSSQDNPSGDAIGTLPSDTNSEEIILHKQDGPGIMMTRNVSVQYSKNK
jgi:hypothetical protein